MRFKSFQIGKAKEKPKSDAEANDTLVTQITNLEEHVNDKTQELEEAEQQLKELSNIMQVSEEGKEASPQPHGPLDELTIEPAEEPGGEEIDTTLFEEIDEEAPVVEVIKAEAAPIIEAIKETPAEATAEAEKEAPDQVEDDSLTGLFSQEEEEVNPLAALINALPDITPQELLDDLQEVKKIMGEWQHN